MLRILHRGTLLAAVGLLGVLVGCRNENDPGNKNGPASSNNPFDVISNSRGASERQLSQNHLKQIMLAIHSYSDSFGHMPSMIFDKKDGKALLSWRVAILPFLEHDNLYKQFKLDEPWDSTHNKALLSQMPKVFTVPGINKGGDTETHYRVFVSDHSGPAQFRAPFSLIGPPKGPRPITLAAIPDGTSNTIAVAEAAEAAPWTKPEGLEFDEKKPLPKLGGFWNGSSLIALFDGSVRPLPGSFDEKEMRKAISYADGLLLNFFP